jgi:hypothetical protein
MRKAPFLFMGIKQLNVIPYLHIIDRRSVI